MGGLRPRRIEALPMRCFELAIGMRRLEQTRDGKLKVFAWVMLARCGVDAAAVVNYMDARWNRLHSPFVTA